MVSQWVAIESTSDRRERARTLAAARELVLSGAGAPVGVVRDVIGASWRRSREAGVDPDHGLAPVSVGAGEAGARWAEHPLAGAVSAARELLRDTARAAHQVLLFCDVDGTLLWIDGDRDILHQARDVRLEPGTVWSEAAAGTNAMGMALTTGHPVQVFSAEHYARPVHDWTCSAAPVHDPLTGATVGVLDLSGGVDTAHPHSLAVVTAAALILEQELRRVLVADRAAMPRWQARGPAQEGSRQAVREETEELTLTVLGRDHALLGVGGEVHTLSPRHSELMTLLALRPSGWSTQQLTAELLGERGKAVSVRAELSRLRRILGPLLDNHPYRLRAPVRSDFAEVEQRIAAGDVSGALHRCAAGELLPDSTSPTIAEARFRLTMSIREAVIASADPDLLRDWLLLPAGDDDAPACRALMSLCPPSDPRHALAAGRLRRLAGAH